MNIIFITIGRVMNVENRGIYTDLMRKFRSEGHHVYIVSPRERRYGVKTHVEEQNGVKMLGVKTLNIQKTNIIEKGIGTILVESQFKRAIKKYFGKVKFDLILYSTPPITFTNVVKYLKRKNPQALSYLLLKDIFPQNAVDIEMFSKGSLFYKYFRRKEIELYKVSDYIGCMSPANVDFVIKNNPSFPRNRVEMAPNSIELVKTMTMTLTMTRDEIREKYGLPTNKPIFVYGGNLGKPQGIDFFIRCLETNKNRTDCHFLVVGNGTEYGKLDSWYKQNSDKNVTLMERLPKEDYDQLVQACDVGLIFLDHRFTIPNYPSRLLSYLEYKMPVAIATDPNTDIGSIAEKNGYGYCCESLNPEDFTALVDKILQSDIKTMGQRGYDFLCKNYLVDNTYNAIMGHFNKS